VDPKAQAKADAKARWLALVDWLMTIDSAVREGKVMISRPNEMYLWQQTGVLIDKGKVYAKFGNAPYQPIGTFDGEGYYPTDGSKLIWSHDFAIAEMTPIASPFKIQKRQAIIDLGESPIALSDKERTAMKAAFDDLAKGLEKLDSTADAGAQKALEDELINTIKYYAVAIKRIDDQLATIAKNNPALKADLSGAEPRSLAKALSEFIRMKLNDDGIRRYHAENEIAVGDTATPLTVVEKCMRRVSSVIPAAGQEWDPEKTKSALEAVCVIYPTSATILEPFFGTSDLQQAAEAALKFLQAEKDKLSTSP
jgi:hypothetical protein